MSSSAEPQPDPELMRRAIGLALEAVESGRGGPFGAVVARDGQVLATGGNLVTSTSDPTAHAEVVAIRAACAALGSHELRGCEIYASCEPCPMCLGAAHWARVDRVWFGATRDDAAAAGFDDALLYQELALPREARRMPLRQVLREEALAAFRAWLADPGRELY
jgi:tRNA(Arg) A34 adenosine deaminase TadA